MEIEPLSALRRRESVKWRAYPPDVLPLRAKLLRLDRRFFHMPSGAQRTAALSHAKSVFKRHRYYPIGLFYPPYGNVVQRLVMKLWLGHGDAALSANGRPAALNLPA